MNIIGTEFFDHRRGNVMLLALLLLAGGIVSGIIISVLVVSEIRQAYTLDNSLLAYYQAEGGLEQGLYDIRQANSCTGALTCDDANFVDCSADAQCQTKMNPASVVTSPLIKKDGTFQIDLNPGDLIDDLTINWRKDIVDPSLSISFINYSSINQLYICRPNNGIPYPCSADVNGQCNSLSFQSEDFTDQCDVLQYGYSTTESQQVRLKALYDDIINLQIVPGCGGRCVFSYYLDVASRGESGRVRYEVKTTVPSQLPSYGFPDYVIFSQQEIVK